MKTILLLLAPALWLVTQAPAADTAPDPPAPAELTISTVFCGFQVCAYACAARTNESVTANQRMIGPSF